MYNEWFFLQQIKRKRKEREMRLNEYQEKAAETAMYDDKYKIIYPSLGLAGEAGEVSEKVKKMLRDDGGELSIERRAGLIKELGDVLWYLAILSRDLGVDLETVAQRNIHKLASRKKRGLIKGDGDNR